MSVSASERSRTWRWYAEEAEMALHMALLDALVGHKAPSDRLEHLRVAKDHMVRAINKLEDEIEDPKQWIRERLKET